MWKTLQGEIIMDYDISKIKNALWNHFQERKGRLNDLIEMGITPLGWEVEVTPWRERRNTWWILDEINYCRGEIEYWKKIMV